MSGKLNREEQVQVVIRLKPLHKEHLSNRSVYVSEEQQKTLVVETPNKKQYFVFDTIADDNCSQQELYQAIGQDAIKSCTEGFNCCIFAYGQTGAGKTYSILGNTQDILSDSYSQSRGILPRLLSDLFSWCQTSADRFWIKCSYLEIYNEQIIDLLNPEPKLRQIREDFKKGVFVEGLSQEHITNYEEAMNALMRGVKCRKTSATAMNDQSSRSHTIFTLYIQSEIIKDDTTKTRRSKINIVDLAGSERAKQTKVQGDRLKEGCNINKSLHVLGNVINALVESTKKKKHIPFRDSKLTYFLKDSLSGNSITKLLANVHPSKMFLGDTLSTLMFAKRAKILKMKVEVNENMTENFQELRKEIRKLREQLAEARYIKNDEKVNISASENDIANVEKVIDISHFDISKHQQTLQIFQQNQINYKALIEIHEEHMKNCLQNNKNRKSSNMRQQWKNIEKKSISYSNLLKNVPAFTKIFRQNIRLKSQLKQKSQKQDLNSFKDLQINIKSIENTKNEPIIQKIKAQYDALIKKIYQKFTSYIEELESAFKQLEEQNKNKDDKIRQLKKRRQVPPDFEELANENQYLKLNVLQLEDQISKYEQMERKFQIQLKNLKQESHQLDENNLQNENQELTSKIQQLKQTFQKQTKQYEQQKNSMITYIDCIKQKLVSNVQENKALLQSIQSLKVQNKTLKKKLNSLLKIGNQAEISKDQNTSANTFWTNQESPTFYI